MPRDSYEVLGVQRDALRKNKSLQRSCSRNFIADVNAHDPEAEEKFKRPEAYENLCDPERRATL